MKTVSGEAAHSKDIDTEAWKVTLQKILEDVDPKDCSRNRTFLQVPQFSGRELQRSEDSQRKSLYLVRCQHGQQ